MNESTILRTVPAANELHKVPGFDPMKYLRRAVNDKGEPVMRLELRYQRLWFRLACPKGRMLLNPLRVTDQLAIFEAKVFFHQNDTTPASSYTANKTVRETPSYIQAAQNEALKVALDNAGFGIQLCDVTQDPGDSENGSPALLVQVSGGGQEELVQPQVQETAASHIPEEGQTVPAPTPAPPVQTVKMPAAEEPAPVPAPVPQTAPITEPVPPTLPETVDAPAATEAAPTAQTVPADGPAPAKEAAPAPAPESAPVPEKLNADQREEAPAANGQQSSLLTVLNFPTQTEETPALQKADPTAPGQEETQAQAAPSYTDDMSVEEICQMMTMEEAGAIVVPRGPCTGWTMAQVAERRPSSLRFFLTKFSECSNSQKAAATLLMQDLERKKAG
ncbi:MAG: hypothetical protein HDT37_06935 [Clostridiales bacterium]|nr:hypothetical protein [Clostridiales bacterium]